MHSIPSKKAIRQFQQLLGRMKSPYQVQNVLDELPYNVEAITRSAFGVFLSKTAHCFDGALFAAAAFEKQGREPLLLDLHANGNDDNHVLAVYRYKNHFGAVAKSNYTGIRFREPVYRSLRELALSYFHHYVKLDGERTLVGYSSLVRLTRLRDVDWRSAPSETDLYDKVSCFMDRARFYRIYPEGFERVLSPGDKRLIAGEALGLNPRGIFGATSG